MWRTASLWPRLCFINRANGNCFRRFSSEDEYPKVPSSADVVIVGGGIIGCSTLYHLTKLGCTNVVLIEKDKLTAGTTWHTAGLIWRLRPNDTDIQILNHTRHLLHEVLEEETGIHPGWVNNGGLFVANSKERLDEYKRLMTVGKAFGIESKVLSPGETKELYPLMNVDDVYGTLYSPGDGTVEPAGFCTALTRVATKAGAKIVEKCPIVGITVDQDDFGVNRVEAVQTPIGEIKTKYVVNCTGVWGPYIGAMAKVRVPLIAMKHAYVVTEKIEGIQGMPNVRDHDLSLYLRLQGEALCIGGYEPNPIFWEKVQKDFAFGLFELDWDVFGTHIQNAGLRVPVLEKAGIKSTVCGPESFTPDHKPLLGEDIEVRGFYHGCGFNSLGMNGGGGCGRELAKWILYGRPDLDMYAYDIRRFNRLLTNNKKWIKERSHEAYVKNYSIVYPNDEPLASRNMIKDPFHEGLLANGCVFQERHGWERPGWFSKQGTAPVIDYDYYGSYEHKINKNYQYADRLKLDYTFGFPGHHETIKSECLGCRNNVAVFDMSYFGKFYLVGKDSQAAVDWIFTNDVSKPKGSTVYTCMLNNRGGVEADLTVSNLVPGEGSPCDPKFKGNGFYIAAGGAIGQQAYSHILTAIQDKQFRVELKDCSQEMGMLSIQGPNSRALLQELTNEDLSNESFPFSTHRVINFAGHKVRALRLTFVGELGWELHIPKMSCVPVYQSIMEKGLKYGLVEAGYRAIDSLSIEKGYRHWHADIRMDDTPLEGGLAFTCKLKTSTHFLGREALEEQRKRGLKKLIGCFTIDKKTPLMGLEAIWRGEQIVGFLRRGDFGFAIDRSIGFGYVSDPHGGVVTPDFLRNGEYTIESLGVRHKAILHTKSPFDPKNNRVKGVYDEVP